MQPQLLKVYKSFVTEVIVSDNAAALFSYEFQVFIFRYGIKCVTTVLKPPSPNGLAERCACIPKEGMQKFTEFKVESISVAYNSTPQMVTGMLPTDGQEDKNCFVLGNSSQNLNTRMHEVIAEN